MSPTLTLTLEEKNSLLNIARTSISSTFTPSETVHTEPTDTLVKTCGVFVTLTINKQLRGCIGNIIGNYPLHKGVEKMAKQAAFSDHRFSPLQKTELNQIHIEISVLSPLFPIEPANVIVGTHGLLLSKGPQGGVFLPQVPMEQGWSIHDYLEGLCQKAGLPSGSYNSTDCQLDAFTAIVFGEK
jgi:AmmeMemoRadiSam system protein A